MAERGLFFSDTVLHKFVIEISEHAEHESSWGVTYLEQKPNRSFVFVNGVEQMVMYATSAKDAAERFKKTLRYLELTTYGATITIYRAE